MTFPSLQYQNLGAVALVLVLLCVQLAQPASITSIYPDRALGAAGFPARITGTFTNSSFIDCQFGDNSVVRASYLSTSSIVCLVPPGVPGTTVTVRVRDNAGAWSGTQAPFSYHDPITDLDISPVSQAATATNQTVYLSSTQLNYTNSYSACRINDWVIPAVTVNSTTVSCATPALVSGIYPVYYSENRVDWFQSARSYVYLGAVLVDSISPGGGPPLGGTLINVYGSNFVPDTDCIFDGTVRPTTWISHTHITCTSLPVGLSPLVKVTAGSGNDTSLTSRDFTFGIVAGISAISRPSFLYATGGNAMTIIGANFQNTGGLVCRVGTVNAPGTFVSPSKMTCSSPAISTASGAYPVTVSNNGVDFSSSSVNIDVRNASTIVSITPNVRSKGSVQPFVINGTGLDRGSGIKCLFGASPGIELAGTVVSATEATCPNPADLGLGVHVIELSTNDADFTSQGSTITVIVPPVVTGITPVLGPRVASTLVTVSGTGFVHPTHCRFGTLTAVTATVITGTLLTCASPVSPSAGSVFLEVSRNNLDYTTSRYAYRYGEDINILSTRPAELPVGSPSVEITLFSQGYVASDLLSCKFSNPGIGTIVSSARLLNSTAVTCMTPTGYTFGTLSVSVSNNGETYSTPYVVPVLSTPTITGHAPSFGSRSGGTVIALSGTNLHTISRIECVFDLDNHEHTQLVTQGVKGTATTASCPTPDVPRADTATVTVRIEDQVDIGTFSFSFAEDVVFHSIRPSPAYIGSALVVTADPVPVVGTLACRFVNATYTSGAQAGTKTAVNETKCGVPPNLAPGTYGIEMTVNGLDYNLAGMVDVVPLFDISAVTPVRVMAQSDLLVTVTGTGFESNPELVCKFDTAATQANVLTSTTLTCPTPAGLSTGSVTVKVSDGHSDVVFGGYTIAVDPVTTVSNVYPSFGGYQGQTTVVVTGTGFTASVLIKCRFVLNDGPPATVYYRPGTFVNTSAITCIVPPAPVKTPTTATIEVSNNDRHYSLTTPAYTYTYQADLEVATITPHCGSLVGGTNVSIATTAASNSEGLSCLFGSNRVVAEYVSSTRVDCVTPAGVSAGSVEVLVSNNGVDAVYTRERFTYSPDVTTTQVDRFYVPDLTGIPVAVTGTNLIETPEFTCLFGSEAASTIEFISSTLVVCYTPATLSTGVLAVTVGNNAAEVVSTVSVNVTAPPTVSSIYPVLGDRAGGSIVTVTGTGFADQPQAMCQFGAITVRATVVSDTEVTCISPEQANLGTFAVRVSNNDKHYSVSSAGFETITPFAVRSIFPPFGSVSGATPVTLRGTDFVDRATARCQFGAAGLSTPTFINATMIVCPSPAYNVTGTQQVTLSLNTQDYNQETMIFEYISAATIATLSPYVGHRSLTTAEVTGTEFKKSKLLTCHFGPHTSKATLISSTRLTCEVPADATLGVHPFSVSNNGLDLVPSAQPFHVVEQPVITHLELSTVKATGGTSIRFFGSNLYYATPHCLVGLDKVPATWISNNEGTCVIPAGPPNEIAKVYFGNNNQDFVTPSNVTILYLLNPGILSVTPVSAGSEGGSEVTVTGVNFVDGATCRFGPTLATASNRISATELRCTLPPLSATTYMVSVSNNLIDFVDDGVLIEITGSPATTSLQPTHGPATGGSHLLLTGVSYSASLNISCRFDNGVATTVVVPARQYVQVTQMYCTTPDISALPGPSTYNVTVALDAANFTETAVPFEFTTPNNITALTPVTRGALQGGTVVTVKGSFSIVNAGEVYCSFGSIKVPVSSQSSTELVCSAPPQLATGAVPLEITTNNLDFTTNSLTFEYVSDPVVTAISPELGSVAGGANITLTGSDFTDPIFCNFNGIGDVRALVVSGSEIECEAPASAAGVVGVEVTVNGVDISTYGFQYRYVPQWSVAGVSPSIVHAAGGTMLTVTGANFLPSELIRCRFGSNNTAPVTPGRYISPSEIECPVAASLILTSIVTVPVEVSLNDDDFTSNGRTLEYIPVPSVAQVAPSSILAHGGRTVTVIGTNFDTRTPFCRIGNSPIPGAAINATHATCGPAPYDLDLVSYSLPIEISWNDQEFTTQNTQLGYVPVPAILSLSPAHGPASGGTTVTFTGQSLVSHTGSFCRVGGAEYPATILSSSVATCAVGAQSPGYYVVELSAPNGEITLSKQFYQYEADMTLVSLDPDRIVTRDVDQILVTTTNAVPTSDLTCRFAGNETSPGEFFGSTLVGCTPPSYSGTGAVSIEISNNAQDYVGGLTLTIVETPIVTSLHPQTGSVLGNTSVTITGQNFPSNIHAKVGLQWADVTSSNDTHIIFLAPATRQPETVAILLSVDQGTRTSPANLNFRYVEQIIVTSVSPKFITGGTSANITVTGRGFLSTLDTCMVGNTNVPGVYLSTTTFQCNVPNTIGAGTFDIVLMAENGQDGSASSASIQVYNIAVSSLSPATLPVTKSSLVTVTGGTFLQEPTLACRVGTTQTPATWLGPSTVVCHLTSPTPGSQSVEVSNDGVHFTNDNVQLTLMVRNITHADPSVLYSRFPREITLAGSNFVDSGSGYDSNITVSYESSAPALAEERPCRFINTSAVACMPLDTLFLGTATVRLSFSKFPKRYIEDSTTISFIDCPVGSICTSESSIAPCPAGFECPSGVIDPSPCRPGTYSSSTGAASCLPCPQGYFCPNVTTVTPTLCPPGFTCPDTGMNQTELCPEGHYCLSGTRARDTSGLAPTPIKCTAGTYCRPGTLSPVTEIGNFSTAQPCLPRFTCPAGSVRPQGQGSCPTGFYCPNGGTPVPCPVGTYCPNTGNTKYISCPAGTFADETGLSECKPCLVGSICPTCDLDASGCQVYGREVGLLCPAGQVCSSAARSTPTSSCPGGHYCLLGTETSNPDDVAFTKRPVPCPPGFYCQPGTKSSTPGNSTDATAGPIPCAGGGYCPSGTASASGISCKAGQYCPVGSAEPITVQPGHYSSTDRSLFQIPCRPGTYSPEEGATTCQRCPNGTECPVAGMSSNSFCRAGYYRSGDAVISCEACPVGTLAPLDPLATALQLTGVTLEVMSEFAPELVTRLTDARRAPVKSFTYRARQYTMPINTLDPRLGFGPGVIGMKTVGDCLPCPEGFVCGREGTDSLSNATLCSPGFYCGVGTTDATQFNHPCKPGYFCGRGETLSSWKVKMCKGGRWCPQGTEEVAKDNFFCAAGYYCPPGTAVSKPDAFKCPPLSTSPAGSSSILNCTSTNFDRIPLDERQLTINGGGSGQTSRMGLRSMQSATLSFDLTRSSLRYFSQYEIFLRIPSLAAATGNSNSTSNSTSTADTNSTSSGGGGGVSGSPLSVLEGTHHSASPLLIKQLKTTKVGNRTTVALDRSILPMPGSFNFSDRVFDHVLGQRVSFRVQALKQEVDLQAIFVLVDPLVSSGLSNLSNPIDFNVKYPGRDVEGTGKAFIALLIRDDERELPLNLPKVHLEDGRAIGEDAALVAFDPSQLTILKTAPAPESAAPSTTSGGSNTALTGNGTTTMTPIPQAQTTTTTTAADTTSTTTTRRPVEVESFDSIYQAPQQVWLGRSAITLPYLPFISACEKYDSYLTIFEILEDEQTCDLKLERQVVAVDPWSPTQEPVGDACSVALTCRYEERTDISEVGKRWYELKDNDVLFYLSRQPVAVDEYATKDPNEYALLTETTKLIPVRVKFAEALPEKHLFRSLSFDIGYKQKINNEKELVIAELSFSNPTPIENNGDSYQLEVNFKALSYFELLNLFAFEILPVTSIFMLVLLLTTFTIVVYWTIHVLAAMVKRTRLPVLRVSQWLKYDEIPKITAVATAGAPTGLALLMVWQLPEFPLYDTTQTSFANLHIPVQEQDIKDSARGRVGVLVVVVAMFLIIRAAVLMVPMGSLVIHRDSTIISLRGRTRRLVETGVREAKMYKRGMIVFAGIFYTLGSFIVVDFSFTAAFQNNIIYWPPLLLAWKLVMQWIMKMVTRDTLYYAPWNASMTMIQYLVLTASPRFITYLICLVGTLWLNIINRMYIYPSLLTFFRWFNPLARDKAISVLQKFKLPFAWLEPEVSALINDESSRHDDMIEDICDGACDTIGAKVVPLGMIFMYLSQDEIGFFSLYRIPTAALLFYVVGSAVVVGTFSLLSVFITSARESVTKWRSVDYIVEQNHKYREERETGRLIPLDPSLRTRNQILDAYRFGYRFSKVVFLGAAGAGLLVYGCVVCIRSQYIAFSDPILSIIVVIGILICVLIFVCSDYIEGIFRAKVLGINDLTLKLDIREFGTQCNQMQIIKETGGTKLVDRGVQTVKTRDYLSLAELTAMPTSAFKKNFIEFKGSNAVHDNAQAPPRTGSALDGSLDEDADALINQYLGAGQDSFVIGQPASPDRKMQTSISDVRIGSVDSQRTASALSTGVPVRKTISSGGQHEEIASFWRVSNTRGESQPVHTTPNLGATARKLVGRGRPASQSRDQRSRGSTAGAGSSLVDALNDIEQAGLRPPSSVVERSSMASLPGTPDRDGLNTHFEIEGDVLGESNRTGSSLEDSSHRPLDDHFAYLDRLATELQNAPGHDDDDDDDRGGADSPFNDNISDSDSDRGDNDVDGMISSFLAGVGRDPKQRASPVPIAPTRDISSAHAFLGSKPSTATMKFGKGATTAGRHRDGVHTAGEASQTGHARAQSSGGSQAHERQPDQGGFFEGGIRFKRPVSNKSEGTTGAGGSRVVASAQGGSLSTSQRRVRDRGSKGASAQSKQRPSWAALSLVEKAASAFTQGVKTQDAKGDPKAQSSSEATIRRMAKRQQQQFGSPLGRSLPTQPQPAPGRQIGQDPQSVSPQSSAQSSLPLGQGRIIARDASSTSVDVSTRRARDGLTRTTLVRDRSGISRISLQRESSELGASAQPARNTTSSPDVEVWADMSLAADLKADAGQRVFGQAKREGKKHINPAAAGRRPSVVARQSTMPELSGPSIPASALFDSNPKEPTPAQVHRAGSSTTSLSYAPSQRDSPIAYEMSDLELSKSLMAGGSRSKITGKGKGKGRPKRNRKGLGF